MLSPETKDLITSLMKADKTTSIRLISRLAVNQLSDNYNEAVSDIKEIKFLVPIKYYLLLLKNISKVLSKRNLTDLRMRFKSDFESSHKL